MSGRTTRSSAPPPSPSPDAPPAMEPRAEINVKATGQNTVSMSGGDICTVTPPDAPTEVNFVWRLRNLGPADVWARWDGQAASIDDPSSITLDAGDTIPSLVANGLSLVCDRRGAGTTRVTFTVTKSDR